MIRLMIADDHALMRDGLRRLLDGHSDIDVVAEAEDQEELLSTLARRDVDVVLLDIAMPGRGFVHIMERLRALDSPPRILVVTMYEEEQWAVRAFQEGAHGYLTKRHTADELAVAIRQVYDGGKYVTPSLAEVLATRLAVDAPALPHESLSAREYQVLCMIGNGLMIKQVASDLGLSSRTVSTYRARILEKMHFSKTADIIRYVVEHRLQRIRPSDPTPILVTSGYSGQESPHGGVDRSIKFLLKPWDLDTLLSTMRGLLDDRPQSRGEGE